MISGKLRHQINDDGVLLVCGPYMISVTESEAKRFAWSILADLDPENEEVVAEGAGDEWGVQKCQVLTRLSVRDADYIEIAKYIERTKEHAASVLSQLRKRGLVEKRGDRGTRGNPIKWGITDAGRTVLFGSVREAAE